MRTKKLWKTPNKKNPAAFKDITYEQFLSHIHAADVSGTACKFESVPERKELITVVIGMNDLTDKMGEKESSPKAAVEGSQRVINEEVETSTTTTLSP